MTAKDYVWLELKRNRGYPWPEDSYGLDPMFGPDGWCHSCGVPRREQQGSMVLQRTSKSHFDGAWVPHWQYDAICLSEDMAAHVGPGFTVQLMPLEWKGPGEGRGAQIVAPSVGTSWFDADTLAARAVEKHGEAGTTCPECGTWRWMPLDYRELPEATLPAGTELDVVASPEWFGAGLNAFRQILVSTDLAELLVKVSPRDFKIVPAVVGPLGT